MSTQHNDQVGERPYRSHRQPACLECRKRKSRCKTDMQSRTCILCRVRGTDCTFSSSTQPDLRKPVARAAPRQCNVQTTKQTEGRKRQRRSSVAYSHSLHSDNVHLSSSIPRSSPEESMGFVNDNHDHVPHVVAPADADDNDDLENNHYTHTAVRNQQHNYSTPNMPASRMGRTPVSFTTVHRRPVGVAANQSPIFLKSEIVEKLIEPYADDIIQLFFDKVNICFPVFNETSFHRIYAQSRQKISAAVLTNTYANALTYWDGSPSLSHKRCPDSRFIWNQANDILNMEALISPGLPVILAMILNIGGRPSTSMFANGGMLGTAVALANALGLNRDPTEWRISDKERLFRIKTWWLLVIQDRWSSLAYGTPLLIHRNQFDVPLPTVDQLCEIGTSARRRTASSIFHSIITLTGVLGHILEHVYNVSDLHAAELLDSDLEDPLHSWEESQTIEIRQIVFRGTDLCAPGAANLRLSYLAVKFLLSRFRMGLSQPSAQADQSVRARNISRAQRAAEEIVHFIQELTETHLRGFWFPTHSFILTSATTFLLRNTINSKQPDRRTQRDFVNKMISTLRVYQQKYGWDLADDCLAKYDRISVKLDSIDAEPNASNTNPDMTTHMEVPPVDGAVPNLSECMQNDLDDYLSLFPFMDEQVFSVDFGEQDQYLA